MKARTAVVASPAGESSYRCWAEQNWQVLSLFCVANQWPSPAGVLYFSTTLRFGCMALSCCVASVTWSCCCLMRQSARISSSTAASTVAWLCAGSGQSIAACMAMPLRCSLRLRLKCSVQSRCHDVSGEVFMLSSINDGRAILELWQNIFSTDR